MRAAAVWASQPNKLLREALRWDLEARAIRSLAIWTCFRLEHADLRSWLRHHRVGNPEVLFWQSDQRTHTLLLRRRDQRLEKSLSLPLSPQRRTDVRHWDSRFTDVLFHDVD